MDAAEKATRTEELSCLNWKVTQMFQIICRLRNIHAYFSALEETEKSNWSNAGWRGLYSQDTLTIMTTECQLVWQFLPENNSSVLMPVYYKHALPFQGTANSRHNICSFRGGRAQSNCSKKVISMSSALYCCCTTVGKQHKISGYFTATFSPSLSHTLK